MSSTRTRLILLAIMIVAFCLATMQLGSRPLWFDEAMTFWRAQLPIPDMVEDSIQHRHTPFYFGVMKVWLSLGDSDFWMRFLSALFFVFTVPVVYVIGRTVGNRRAGLYAACLVATAPFLLHYAREARMYAMLTFFCSLALMSAALLISRQSDQPPPVIGAGLRGLWRQWRGSAVRLPIVRTIVQGGGDDLLWLTYMVAVLGAMFSHNTAIMLPIVTTLIFLVAIAAAPRFRWRQLWNLIIASLAVLALYAFWIPGLLQVLETGKGMEWRLAPIDRIFLRAYTSYGIYENEGIAQATLLALLVLCALALWGWRRREDWRWVAFTLAGWLGLPLLLLVASAVYRPVFYPRVIVWTAIPLYVACGVGLARLPYAGLRYLVLAGLLLINLYSVGREYGRDIYEPWDEVTAALAEVAGDAAAVVICPHFTVRPFNYYWRDYERETTVFARVRAREVVPFLEAAHGEVSKWNLRGEKRDLVSLLDDYALLWLVIRVAPHASEAHCVSIPEDGMLVAERRFGDIRLLGYVSRQLQD